MTRYKSATPAGVRTQVAKDEELSWNDYIPINLLPVPKYCLSKPRLPTVNRCDQQFPEKHWAWEVLVGTIIRWNIVVVTVFLPFSCSKIDEKRGGQIA